jgi:hypothetical protein
MGDGPAASDRATRWYGTVVSVVLLGAVCSPLARRPPRDDFPLSHYPMFASEPARREAPSYHVLARARTGRARPVPPDLLGSEEIMQAHQTVHLAIRRGPEAARALCETVALRIAREGGEAWADVDALEVRTDRFDPIAYWEGDRAPRDSKVHARCSMPAAGGS